MFNISASNGDTVVLGSLTPNSGGSLSGLLGGELVKANGADAQVDLLIHDSGDTSTTPE